MSAALLIAWAMAAPTRVVEVRSEKVEGRPAVVVVAASALGDVSVRRDGPEVVMSLLATASEPLRVPAVAAPLESLRIERTPEGLKVRVRVAPTVGYEVRRELARVVLLFGDAAAAAPPASSAELYRGLFPPSPDHGEGGSAPGPAGQPTAPETQFAPPRPPEEKRDGLHLGILTLRPSATMAYVDADVSLLDTPRPERDHYAEARPALGLILPLRDGSLDLSYEARIRAYSSFPALNGVSHQANARLDYPAGPAITLRGSGHFARGLLETTEVDSGREYFFSLARFTRRQFGAGIRANTGSRIDLDVAGGLDKVTLDQGSGFFDYERRTATGGLGIEIGPERRASFNYVFEQVPASPERPLSESRIHSVSAAVDGEILPLLSGRASVGFARRESPRAAPPQRFRGVTFGAQLKREFGRSANVVVWANRSTELSAFEQNAFYLTTSVQGVLTAPLPFSFSATAGGGYQVNRYPTPARELGAARRDQIVHWLVGLGRSLSRWGFVRVDYRQDRRVSNIDFFDQRTHAFYAQLGLGFLGEPARR